MYSCYDPYLVFGICETSSRIILDGDELAMYEEYNIFSYAREVIRNHATYAVYGCTLRLNLETGEMSRSERIQMQAIQELFARVTEHHERNGLPSPKLGYHLVVAGDYDTEEMQPYMLDE